MKEMSTIKFPNQTEPYEIVDAAARKDIAGKSDIGHTHTRSEITDFAHDHDERYYTRTENDTALAGKADSEHTHEIADVNGLEEALEAAASSGGSSWNDITDKPLDVGETETITSGGWAPMAADGVTYMGEEVRLPGYNSTPLRFEYVASPTNEYRATIDGTEYLFSTTGDYVEVGELGIWLDSSTMLAYISRAGDKSAGVTVTLKLESYSAGITTGWLTDGEGNNFAPKTLFSQVQAEDGVTLEEALEAAASSGGSSWNDITDKPLDVGETETGDGAWLPMAADGVSYMGEEVSVPGTKWDETLTIYVIPSDTNQYRVTIDGVEYSASVDTSTGYSMLTLEGYDGPIHFSYSTDDTGDHLDVMRTSTTDGTYSIKLERWSTSAGITTGWLTDGEGNNFAPKTLFSQVQADDGTTLEEALNNIDLSTAELITVDDIDAICGTTIQMASEVTF